MSHFIKFPLCQGSRDQQWLFVRPSEVAAVHSDWAEVYPSGEWRYVGVLVLRSGQNYRTTLDQASVMRRLVEVG